MEIQTFGNPQRRHMSKFDILDDCNFDGPCLLPLKYVLGENCWVGFQFKSSFCSKNFSSIQDVMKIWHAF